MGPADHQVGTTAATGALPGNDALSADAELILNSIAAGVVTIDAAGRTTLINDAACRMLGLNPSDAIGHSLHALIHHSRPDGSVYPHEDCPVLLTAHDGISRHNEADVFWRSDGTSFPVEFDSHPIRQTGALAGALLSFRDITERQRSEERTRQLVREQFARAKAEFQHAQLREALAQTPALVCVTRGPRHVIEVVNERYDHAAGGRAKPGLAIREAFPEMAPDRLAQMDRAYETGEPFAGREAASPVGGGAESGEYFDFVIQPLRDETGTVYGLMTHAVDVTEQVRARRDLELRTAELEKTSERLRLAAEAGRMGAWEWHITRNEVVWSPELERIHGLQPGTFDGTFAASQSDIHPDDREPVLTAISDSLQHRTPHRLEYRIVLPDGRVRWLEARGRLFLNDAGQPERLVGICMDVTERKRAEQALLFQNRASDLMARVGLVLTRSDSIQESLQACAQAVLEYADAALVRIWLLEDNEEVLRLHASAGMYTHLDGPHSRVPVGQFKIGTIAKERRPHLTNQVIGDPLVGDQAWAEREGMVSFAGYPLMLGGTLVGVLGMFARHSLSNGDLQALGAVGHAVAIGVTRKRQEQALRDSEENMRTRAEELAQLALALERSNRELDAFAYAASHDLRAPLRGIANLAQWIEEDLQDRLGDDTREMLALMRTRMHRMEALIDGLLQYSRAGRVHQAAERIDTRRLVSEIVDLISPPDGVTIEVADDLPTITTERLPLQQVLMNLVGNAVKHAARDDARVSISARRAGSFWEFAVADNGPGIEPQYRDRIWGIFQTLETRDKVEGTGIGLALVKKLVEAQGGRAWVESTPGQGATFRFSWRAL